MKKRIEVVWMLVVAYAWGFYLGMLLDEILITWPK